MSGNFLCQATSFVRQLPLSGNFLSQATSYDRQLPLCQAWNSRAEHWPGGGAVHCDHPAQAGTRDSLGLQCHVSTVVHSSNKDDIHGGPTVYAVDSRVVIKTGFFAKYLSNVLYNQPI